MEKEKTASLYIEDFKIIVSLQEFIMSTCRKIFTVITIIWMVVIFAYSAQPGQESTEDSIWAGMLFGRIFVPDFEEWSQEEQLEFAKGIDHPVRKAAHATEYAILGFFATFAWNKSKNKGYKRFLVPWLFASIYAATDEIHQLFVPGRHGSIWDVLLDSSGAVLGVLAALFIVRIGSKRKEQACAADSKCKINT